VAKDVIGQGELDLVKSRFIIAWEQRRTARPGT